MNSQLRTRSGGGVAAAVAVLLCAGAVAAAAQELPRSRVAPLQPPKQTTTAPALPQAATITANVSLVNVVFTVEGKHGGFIDGLGKDDFQVKEDGRPQPLQFFSAEHQLPLTLGLLLDTSPSQRNTLTEQQAISDSFFREVLQPHDLAFVIGFDVQVQLLRDFTNSARELSEAVDTAHIGGADVASMGINPGTFPGGGSQGATHLWDAVYLACHDELAHQAGRKAIIVVTDGGEQGSSYTHEDALRAALDSNTVVYTIMTYDSRDGGYDRGPGPGDLHKITEQTGGRTLDGNRDLGKAFSQLADELRSQYSLGYHSDQTAKDGKFRKIEITLTDAAKKRYPDAKIRARSGYFAPSSKSSSN